MTDETPEEDTFRYPVTKVANLSLSQYLAFRVENYHKRTGRNDGLAIINDVLSTYGVRQFSQMPPVEQLEVVAVISDMMDKAS